MKRWVLFGSVSGLLAVSMGAFGAHLLNDRLDAKMMAIYQTGVQYQMYHAIALVGLGAWSASRALTRRLAVAGWCFTLGTVIFSGSLYLLALTGMTALGMITPIGGALFLAGWVALGLSALQKG